MKLLLGESSGATGEDVDCGGLCLSNFNDIRFTTSDGTTLLDYWIESITGTTPNQLATVWIEFDSIGTSDTTFYMYFGNAVATAASNIKTTFPVGDDFNDNVIDTEIWTETDPGSLISETGGRLSIAAPHTSSIAEFANKLVSNVSISSGIVSLQANITWTTDSTNEAQTGVYVYADNSNFAYLGARSQGGKMRIRVTQGGTSKYSLESTVPKDNTYKITYDISTYNIKFWYLDNGTWTQIGVTQEYNLGASFNALMTVTDSITFNGADPTTFDNLIMHNVLGTEPTWGSWGAWEGLVADPVSYLTARRDRMNMRPVSTQDQLG